MNNPLNVFLLAFIIVLMGIGCSGGTDLKESQTTTPSGEGAPIENTKFNQLKDGKKEELWKSFHANGKLKSEGNYIAGLKVGLHKKWEDNGNLIEEVVFISGKQTGLTKWYHPKGQLAASGQMVDGVREGPWMICDIEENGFCIDAFFEEGKRSGVWKIYHDNAHEKLWKEQTFKDDHVVSERCWDENGILASCDRGGPSERSH